MAEGPDPDDKTEDPTQRKLDEAAKRGDVAKSQELPVFLSLAGLALALILLPSLGTGRTAALDLRAFLMNAHLVPEGGAGALSAARRGLSVAFAALAVPVGLAVAAALLGGLVQHRPLWTVEPLMPKGERLSPLAGVKRILGKQALVQFGKGLAKIGIVGTLAGAVLWGERDRLEGLVGLGPGDLAAAAQSLAAKLLGGILALYAVLTAADVVWQRLSWMRRQRMSRDEVKREMKEQDGNPEIKAKLRQIRAARVRRRMMADVPKATVVLANPTHFAVALRYEAGMAAPVCVAKGVDALALRIRSVAEEHRVPVVVNPPLARALHATVEIDDEIPVEHYKAVAEVIGFVLRSGRRAS